MESTREYGSKIPDDDEATNDCCIRAELAMERYMITVGKCLDVHDLIETQILNETD